MIFVLGVKAGWKLFLIKTCIIIDIWHTESVMKFLLKYNHWKDLGITRPIGSGCELIQLAEHGPFWWGVTSCTRLTILLILVHQCNEYSFKQGSQIQYFWG
jgi:hypothetical protein